IPPMTTTMTVDPLTLELQDTTNPVGVHFGATYDGFGRVQATTTNPPGASQLALTSTTYVGFDGSAPRSVTRKDFPNGVPLAQRTSASGRSSTTLIDEVGRPTQTSVELGPDYYNFYGSYAMKLIVGRRIYDSLGRVVFEADPYAS